MIFYAIVFIVIAASLALVLDSFLNVEMAEFKLDLSENDILPAQRFNLPSPKAAQPTLRTAIKMSLATVGNANVHEVHQGLIAAGYKASKTMLKKLLRDMRNSGMVKLLTDEEGHRAYKLTA